MRKVFQTGFNSYCYYHPFIRHFTNMELLKKKSDNIIPLRLIIMTVPVAFQENTFTSKLEQAMHELTIHSTATSL